MIIFIKTMTGNTFEVEAKESDSIENLKRAISLRLKYSIDVQILYYNSIQLKNSQTLVQSGVREEALIYLVVRLKVENILTLPQVNQGNLIQLQCPLSIPNAPSMNQQAMTRASSYYSSFDT